MKRYGLIGRSLAHSQSRRIHGLIADYEYDNLEIESSEELESLLKDTRYSGFNITNPYRLEVMKYLDVLSDDAIRAGSVNVVKRLPDGRLEGHNTDMDGFRFMLRNMIDSNPEKAAELLNSKSVILGTGGVATGCAEVLKEIGSGPVILVSRDAAKARRKLGGKYEITGYDRLYMHYDARVIVNCTPCGQLPDVGHSPLTDRRLTVRMFTDLALAADLIYNPYRTKFLQDARRLTGCKTRSGLEMLIVQAIVSRDIWLDQPTDPEYIKSRLTPIKRSILEDQINIVVVGMPGSGKTVISRRYAYELGLDFIDTDAETEKLMGITIGEALSDDGPGEEYFRQFEHRAVREACMHTRAVIATGGGTILNPINRDLLRSNGIVVYMKRPLDHLDVKGRPISISVGVSELFRKRDGIYRRVSDMSLYNSRIFGERRQKTGSGNSYNYELRGFVFYIARKIEKYISELADNKWT